MNNNRSNNFEHVEYDKVHESPKLSRRLAAFALLASLVAVSANSDKIGNFLESGSYNAVKSGVSGPEVKSDGQKPNETISLDFDNSTFTVNGKEHSMMITASDTEGNPNKYLLDNGRTVFAYKTEANETAVIKKGADLRTSPGRGGNDGEMATTIVTLEGKDVPVENAKDYYLYEIEGGNEGSDKYFGFKTSDIAKAFPNVKLDTEDKDGLSWINSKEVDFVNNK
jgi:hypothetical protein